MANLPAIGTVKDDGRTSIYIYDEKGRLISYMPRKDGLIGFTSTTVSVKWGDRTNLYDANSHLIRTI